MTDVDLDEVIELLRGRGLACNRRSWSLGDTVEVPLGAPTRGKGGIAVYPSVAWILRGSDASWAVMQAVGPFYRSAHRVSAQAAVDTVVALRRCFDLDEPCTCGARRHVAFGETTSTERSFQYFVSTRCDACGAATESDGAGGLPEHWRQIELQRGGRWAVSVTSASTAQDLAALRREFDLDLGGLARLRATLPGVVLRGTYAEVQRCSARLTRDGVDTLVTVDADDPAGWRLFEPDECGRSAT